MRRLLHLALAAAPCAALIALMPASAQPRPSARYCAGEAGQGRYPPGCPRPKASTPAPSRPQTTVRAQPFLRSGSHRCQLSAEYRYNSCTIREIGPGQYEFNGEQLGLMGLSGRLTRQGTSLLFEGRMTDAQPFFCNYGNKSVSDWPAVFARCRNQTLRATLRKVGSKGWEGFIEGLHMQAEYAGTGDARRAVSNILVPYDQWPLPLTILN